MKTKHFSPITRLFEYDSLVVLYSRVANVLMISIIVVILSGFIYTDYSSTSHIGLLTARSILLIAILISSIFLSRRLKPAPRAIRKRPVVATLDYKSLYLILSISLLITAVYIASFI